MTDYNEKLGDIRENIDRVDAEMLVLFQKRMKYVGEVAVIKSEVNLPILDKKRELEIIKNKTQSLHGNEKGETIAFIRCMMGISKMRQRIILHGQQVSEQALFPKPRAPITQDVKVAFQGLAGAWTEAASVKLFPDATQIAMEHWEDIFVAVKSKKVHYGVLPLENSQTGAIGEVYDLLRQHGCYIVGQTWIAVNHCLMGTSDATLSGIREVYSHPQGFQQCRKFLKGHDWNLSVCRNTAMAAEKVADSKDVSVAAIGSKRAAELYGLKILSENIADNTKNKTRFIVIADMPEYSQESDTVSIIFRTAHHSGALIDALFPLMSENVNLNRLESRPVADGKYCFFADIQGNITDANVISALKQADSNCGFLEILGCYNAELKSDNDLLK